MDTQHLKFDWWKDLDTTEVGTAEDFLLARACSYPARPGNLVMPLIGGRETFRRIANAVADARSSVWVTVAFISLDMVISEAHGDIFDVFDRAARRGIDVRILIWRPHPSYDASKWNVFMGTAEDHSLLRARDARFRIRWDMAPAEACHHQKSWLIDAGTAGERAFVGGINPTVRAINRSCGEHLSDHDVYVEFVGPAVSDVQHNFVQRWNGATEIGQPDGSWLAERPDANLTYPTDVGPEAGPHIVQVSRTIGAGVYRDTTAAVGSFSRNIASGEQSILNQYCAAIDASRYYVYLEQQSVESPELLERLLAAIKRGVRVVFLVPADWEEEDIDPSADKWRSYVSLMSAMSQHENFCILGLATVDSTSGRCNHVYIHSKLIIVDDVFVSVGSCNGRTRSFTNYSEMNLGIWSKDFAKGFRQSLMRRHMNGPHLDEDKTLAGLVECARSNANRYDKQDFLWNGGVFALRAMEYRMAAGGRKK